jgi:hypothetical protein
MKKNRMNLVMAAAVLLAMSAALAACNGKAQSSAKSGGGGAASGGGSSGGGVSASAALKIFQQATPDADAIVKAVRSLSDAALAQLTRQNGSPSGDFSYDLTEDGKGIVIREYTKKPVDAVVIVPETIEDIPVTEIEGKANSGYNYNRELTTIHDSIFQHGAPVAVVLPATVTRIGDNAFVSYIDDLASVNFPAGLKEIGEGAFARTELTSVTLPEGLVSLGYEAFADCGSLVSLTLPGSLKTIPDEAFKSTAITEVVIPEGVETIGAGAFGICNSLLKVTLPSTIKEIGIGLGTGAGAFDGCTELADIVIPDSVTSIAWFMLAANGGKLGKIYDSWDTNGFPNSAFEDCGKLKLAVRQRLKDLGYKGAF